MRRRPAWLAPILLATAAAAVRADEIVLENGKTLAGRIVKEDDHEVTLQFRGGKMTFAKDEIAEIRRGPAPPGTDDPPSASPKPPSERTRNGSRKDPRSAGAKDGGRKRSEQNKSPVTARDLLVQLDEIRLVPWPDEETTVANEPGLQSYKVVLSDTSVSMRGERPKGPDGIARLYMLVESHDGMFITFVNGRRQLYWRPLYWHADRGVASGEWRINSPELEAFQRDGALARRIADRCCSDENGRIAAAIEAHSMRQMRTHDKPPPIEKQRAELLDACARATGSPDAGALLARCHEIDIAIDSTRLRTEKIQLARERRSVLRSLVAATGR